MKYKICLLLLVVALLLSSCAISKEVKRESENVIGVVVSTNYVPPRIIPITCGTVITFMSQPASYRVVVEYNGIQKVFDDSFLYNNYKAGDNINLTLITIYYDNNEVRYKLERV